MIIDEMQKSGVAVWSFLQQQFVSFVPCSGEKRVRIDVLNDLENYAVFDGRYERVGDGLIFYPGNQLADWRIDYT